MTTEKESTVVNPDPSRNKKGRNVLLVEPNYRNKYPPLGLMKLSSYHKENGDSVTFFKGKYSDYFLEEKFKACISKIKSQGFEIEDWTNFERLVWDYIKYRRIKIRQNILELVPKDYFFIVHHHLVCYANKYLPEKKWDRVYVTTLFTFYWKQTLDAIEFAKKIVKSKRSIYIGGVAASLIPELFAQETRLSLDQNIITGLLDKPGMLDDNNIIIDEITTDYSILETVDYHYPLDTGYLTYTTKGCTRSCSFCAVPRLEPIYKKQISIKKQIQTISKKYGERKDLILMDNNVLGSPRFPEIIEEILDIGFKAGATFVESNKLEIFVNYLQQDQNCGNKNKYLEKIFHLLQDFGQRRIKKSNDREQFFNLLEERQLNSLATLTEKELLSSKNDLNEFIEKYRNKSKKMRYVDFNQGIDSRYVNEENMALLSQLPIRPMRIAFDHISLCGVYENAVRLADKYGVKQLSNYILFNYKDKPQDFWKRLEINLNLNSELQATIYSFPMKYIPVYGKESTNRKFLGSHWNQKYIRAIQCILNATKGIVTVNPTFFYKAFGKDIEEYLDILMMPEYYILYRKKFEENGQTEKWYYQFKNLNRSELKQLKLIVHSNNFISNEKLQPAILELLKHYQFKYKPEKNNI
ncbi:MAG: hypothetical protein D3911_10380 [Candidatus Electrothrix sp. AW3_4]|nr:hypothetical protein [Candidatus Electrothrix gigas]